MLEINQVYKRFPQNTFTLQNISCSLNTGLYVLAGPNGSGKSTLLRIAAGIMRPDAGSILYCGRDVSANFRAYKHKLGYLPQTLSFYAHMTGMDFLLYLANLKGLFGNAAKQRSSYVADLLNIQQHCSKKISTWSVGLRQRLGLAQTLLNDPAILILDEPFCGLAFEESVEIRNLLHYLAETKTVLLSSHLIDDLPVNKLLLLVNGTLKFSGLPSIFIDQAQGQVWTVKAPKSMLPAIKTSFPDSTAIYTENGCHLRIISCAKPQLPNIEPAVPTLEEAYLIWLQQVERNEAYA